MRNTENDPGFSQIHVLILRYSEVGRGVDKYKCRTRHIPNSRTPEGMDKPNGRTEQAFQGRIPKAWANLKVGQDKLSKAGQDKA